MSLLIDEYNRQFTYLRLSLTDVCNFRCQYCLPNGYQKKINDQHLSIEEIHKLIKGFAELGIKKVRLTGGEPTLRKDLPSIIKTIKSIEGIEHIGLTTNGYSLHKNIQELKDSGLDSINISLDSIVPQNFNKICGNNFGQQVKDNIEQALSIGFSSVKVNSVLLKTINAHEIPLVLEWIKDKNLTFRFIELMRTGENKNYFEENHLAPGHLMQYLKDHQWQNLPKKNHEGPACVLNHSNYKGKIGIIEPYSKDFCTNCNRLRINSTGNLKLCLFGNEDYSLRPLLQSNSDKELLKDKIVSLLKIKPQEHLLIQNETGITNNLSIIGG